MPDKPKQKAPRQVRLYPPIEAAWDALKNEDNFNYFVNVCFAEKLGVQIDIDEYRRAKK